MTGTILTAVLIMVGAMCLAVLGVRVLRKRRHQAAAPHTGVESKGSRPSDSRDAIETEMRSIGQVERIDPNDWRFDSTRYDRAYAALQGKSAADILALDAGKSHGLEPEMIPFYKGAGAQILFERLSAESDDALLRLLGGEVMILEGQHISLFDYESLREQLANGIRTGQFKAETIAAEIDRRYTGNKGDAALQRKLAHSNLRLLTAISVLIRDSDDGDALRLYSSLSGPIYGMTYDVRSQAAKKAKREGKPVITMETLHRDWQEVERVYQAEVSEAETRRAEEVRKLERERQAKADSVGSTDAGQRKAVRAFAQQSAAVQARFKAAQRQAGIHRLIRLLGFYLVAKGYVRPGVAAYMKSGGTLATEQLVIGDEEVQAGVDAELDSAALQARLDLLESSVRDRDLIKLYGILVPEPILKSSECDISRLAFLLSHPDQIPGFLTQHPQLQRQPGTKG